MSPLIPLFTGAWAAHNDARGLLTDRNPMIPGHELHAVVRDTTSAEDTFESHVVRTTVRNVSSAMANRDTFPDWNNYAKIWKLCIAEYENAA